MLSNSKTNTEKKVTKKVAKKVVDSVVVDVATTVVKETSEEVKSEENLQTLSEPKNEGISLKTNAFENLGDLKIEMQKAEFASRIPLSTEEILEKTIIRVEKLQRQNDYIMHEVLKSIPTIEILNIKPIVLKVFRGKKLYFATAEAKFKFGGKTFFILSHKEAVGDGIIQFIESLDVLSSSNRVLRVQKKL